MGFIKSFGYAARGVWYCIRHERNFRIHLGIAAYVLAFAYAVNGARGFLSGFWQTV